MTFAQTGLSSDASGTVVTVNGVAKTFSDLPYTIWVDNGTVVAYSYEATVSSTIPGEKFSLINVTGPSSPITVTGPVTVTGNYKTQYYLAVGTDPIGIVTIPGEGEYDSSTDVTLTAPTVANYNFVNWDVDGVSQGSGVNPITVHMDGPHTATAHYQAAAPPEEVGGFAVLIDDSSLFASTMGLDPWIGIALIFLVVMALVIILIRRGNKVL